MKKPFALIIDDDRDIVALFRHVLDIAGYHTEILLNGKTAVERLFSSTPDIVLLDLNLPGVSGMDIFHMIRTQAHLRNTQVVVITAHSHIAQMLEDEPDLVLLKPVNIEQLSNLVQRLRPTEKSIDESPLDELTGFYNSSFFKSRLDYSLARLQQLDLSHFTVLLVDLDNFRDIENQMGWEAGRRLVKETAHQLRIILRPTDTLARFEKAKFGILIEDIRHWDIPILLANRILVGIERHLEEESIQSHVYIGIILCHEGYSHVDKVLEDAEASLALAKSEGKNCYKFYAQDNLNHVYNLDMINDMISIAGSNPLITLSATRRTGIQVRQMDGPR